MNPNLPLVVLYTVAGISRPALVFGSNDAAVDHQGENSEPTLNLAFFAPEREPGSASARIGYEPAIYKAYDVVHASQEFTDEFKLKHGLQTPAQISQMRGDGEWDALSAHAPSDPELAAIDAVLARRPALADLPNRVAMIDRAISVAAKSDALEIALNAALKNKFANLVAVVDAETALDMIHQLHLRVTQLTQPQVPIVQVPAVEVVQPDGDGAGQLMPIDQAKALMQEFAGQQSAPSAADLDAHAEEEKAREATSGEPQAGCKPAGEQQAAADSSYPQIL